MPWPWQRIPKVEQPKDLTSISDPVLATYFGVGQPNFSGVPVNEHTALGISAVWRAVNLISGTIASLPLKTYRETDDRPQRVASILDDPYGPGSGYLTPYEWKQTVVAHLLLHGHALLFHRRNQAGALIGLQPIHPLTAQTDQPDVDSNGVLLPKSFRVTLPNGKQQTLIEDLDVTEILGFSTDGWYGQSVISVARNSFGTHIAGDRAAARMFNNGFLASGLVTPNEDIDEEEAKAIKAGLDEKTTGWENAGGLAFVNRNLKFDKWTMSAEDAQFLESRQFEIEEVARWFGIPPFELMQTEKQTSWGTGIEAQQRGLARGNLLGWTMRAEQRLSRLLATPRYAEFDFAGLERPTPEQEIRLLIEQVNAGLITVNEARRIRNLAPIEGGDVMRGGSGETATRELQLVEQIQKIYLGVGTVITAAEAREILNRSGAELDLSADPAQEGALA